MSAPSPLRAALGLSAAVHVAVALALPAVLARWRAPAHFPAPPMPIEVALVVQAPRPGAERAPVGEASLAAAPGAVKRAKPQATTGATRPPAEARPPGDEAVTPPVPAAPPPQPEATRVAEAPPVPAPLPAEGEPAPGPPAAGSGERPGLEDPSVASRVTPVSLGGQAGAGTDLDAAGGGARSGRGFDADGLFVRPLGGYQVRPRYPESARRERIEGTTLLRARVNEHGRVEVVEVERSAGHAELDRSAVDAVRRWRFEPARRGEDAVAVWVLIPVKFELR